jgi:sugar phosphate isomerase/epimerase
MLERMGSGLAHVHLADGMAGSGRDEHLVPGRGEQPCAEVCERLTADGFDGVVVIEINTRRCRTRYERVSLLAESLLFARLHLQPTAAPEHRPAPRPDPAPSTR